MSSNRLLEAKDYQERLLEVGEPSFHVSKSDVAYQRIPISYDGGQFLLRVPKCKSFGVQTNEMENGYTRRTMPLVFNDEQTEGQEEFSRVFSDIARRVYEQLVQVGYRITLLSKLGSCFWRDKILYAGIVESLFESRTNTRYFIGEKEVDRKTVGEGKEYEATAAVLIDSIYVGPKTVSIQVKLYEVSLIPSDKRGRVL